MTVPVQLSILLTVAVWVCAAQTQAPPPVIEPISDETVLIGGNEAFFCDASGSEDLNVTLVWSRTGVPLEDDSSHIRLLSLFQTLLLLSIIDVGIEDEAVYTCTATNSDGIAVQSVNLTVIGLPEFIESLPLMIEVDFGQPLTLNCSARNHPQITQDLQLMWLMNGSPVAEDNRVTISTIPEDASHTVASQLTFSSVGLGDPGTYTCFVHNRLPIDNITSETQLTVFVQPPVIDFIEDRNITIGETETIACTAISSVNVTLEWSRIDGTLLVKETLEPTQAKLDLHISNVGTADAGIYQCTATNVGGTSSQNTTLTVIGLPIFIMELPLTTAAEHGDVLTLTCTAQNFPTVAQDLAFVWQVDGMEFPNSSRVRISNTPENASNTATSELIFSPVQLSDSRNYTCLVHNREPEDGITSQTELNVTAFPPTITEPALPEDVLGIVAGNNVTFAVVATGSALMYQWQQNLVNVSNTERFTGVNTANLTIGNVEEGDEGNYSCIVSNIIGNATSRSAELTVLDSPMIVMQPLNQIDVFPGSNVSFNVTVTGMNLSFSWEFDNGDPLPANSTYIGSDTNEFTILDVEEMDEGTYRCSVSNPAGITVSDSVLLIVYDPPNITNATLPNDQLNIPEGQTVMFTVEATGTEIEYQWQRDGNDLSNNVRFIGMNLSTLTITDVVEEDGGNYTCVVSNALGNLTSKAAELTVFGPPIIFQAPIDMIAELDSTIIITCIATGGGTLAISWNSTASITLPTAQEITSRETLNSLLNLTDIGAAHGGEYICTATNEAGRVSANTSLFVLPTIISQPVAILTTNGSVVSLQCEAEGFPDPSYQWQKLGLGGGQSEGVSSDNFADVEDAVHPRLEFSPVEFGDEGLYRCVVFSPAGNDTSEAVAITISPEGSVIVSPVNGTFRRQDNVNFSCSALGGLGNTFQWIKDGVELENETSGLLTLLGINATSGGEYTCTVSNAAGNESASTFLFVSPEILVQPVSVNTTNGSMAVLRCDAEAFPEPEYLWEHINGTTGDNVIGTNTNELVFNPVLFGNEGNYLCTVNSNRIKVSSETATLTVSPQGSVTATPEEVIAGFGDNATFTCTSQGGPGNSYRWHKNGIELPNEISEMLTVTSVATEDGGDYTCVVSNNAGSENATAVLYIMPRIVQNPSDVLTLNGSTVNLTCIADGFPAPAYRWEILGGSTSGSGSGTHDDFLQPSLETVPIDMVADPILEFTPVVFGDEGIYLCVVFSTLPDGRELRVEANATLTISPEGSVVAVPALLNAVRNTTVPFTCTAEGGPGNVLTWTRLFDGEIVSRDGVLMVLVDSPTDGSDYQCLVRNAAGSEAAIVTLNVAPAIPFPPVATNVTDTEDLTLTCTTSGYPVPMVVMWTHNGTILDGSENRTNITEENEDRSLTSTLTVTATDINTDSGEYECIVTSPLSAFNNVTSGPVMVLVQNTPEQPQNVTGEALNSTAVQLTWVEPHDNNAPVSNYTISYTEPDFLNSTTLMLVVEMELAVVTGLHPGVNYTFTVIAVNDIGPSRKSIPAIITTDEEAPSGSPQNVQTNATTSTAILVSWMPVLEIAQNGIITTHEIQYEPLMTFSGLVESGAINTTSGADFLQLVTGLEEYVEYNIRVRAYTSEGPGPFSPAETERTLEDEPAIFPPDVRTFILSSTEVLVTWELLPEIHQNGIIANYNVKLEPLDFTEELTRIFVNSSNLSAIITGLEEFIEYNISVRAYTSVGPGPFSPVVVNRTFEDEPAEAPQNVEVFAVSSTMIVVTWEEVPPTDQNGIITQYEVRINQSTFDEVSLSDFVFTNGSTMMVEWDNLEEFVEYSIRVRALTSVGPGPFSIAESNRTLEDAPSNSPQNVSAQALSSTEILVTWKPVPPIDQNGIVTEYEVEFNQSKFEEIPISNLTTVNASVLVIEVRDLEEDVDYSFRVRAFTNVGSGPYSQAGQARTSEAAPSGYPQQVEASTLFSTEILVTWDPVPGIDQNGIITAYEIQYEPLMTFSGAVAGGTKNTSSGSESSLVITGLEEFVEYSISVRGHTSVGPGPFSPVVSNTTFEDEPAAPPQNVTTIAVSPTEIIVSWDEVPAIDQNGIIINYQVQLEPLQFTETLETIFVNATNTSMLVTGLEEYVEYNISVRAYTSVGAGPFSRMATERTLEDEPSASPQNVQTSAVSSTVVLVNWENVPAIDQNGILTSYEIMFEPQEFTDTLNTTFLNATSMFVMFPNLEEFVEYNISVRAYTSVGPGPFSPVVTNRTLEDTPATPPTNIQSTVLSSTAIVVTWENVLAIDRNGIIIQFEVQISQSTFTENSQRIMTTNGSVFMLEWNGLEEFVEYNITIRAFTSIGPGPFSTVIMNTTFEDVPSDYPRDLLAFVLSPTEIQVTWEPVPRIEQNGIITQYEVEFNQSTFSEISLSNTTTISGSVLEVILIDLEEVVEYSIRVRAFTNEGPGPYSPIENATTPEAAPSGYPQNVEVLALSSIEILIRWDTAPPIDENGIITTYEIEYEPQMTFNGDVSGGTLNTSSNSLQLTGLEEFVEYNVSVRAYTSVGSGPFSPVVTNRTLEDEPAAFPQNVRAFTVSSRMIMLTWEEIPAIDHNGIITVFEVFFEPLQFEESLAARYINATDLVTIISDLQEFVEYNISVRAYTSVGPGPFSPVVTNRTFEDEPAAPPQNVRTTVLSPNEMTATWGEVPAIDQNGIVVMYEVQVLPLQLLGMLTTLSINTTNTSVFITALEEYVQYNISVSAYTSVGPGPFSPAVTNRTFEDEPTAPPQNLQAPVLSSTEIMVTWEEVPAVDQNGIIVTYEVLFEPIQFSDTLMSGLINTSELALILAGLEEFVEYNFSVRAYTTVGPGPFSPEVTNRTLEAPLNTSPMNVTAIALSTVAIEVSWEEIPEIDRNSDITQYEVHFSQSTLGEMAMNGSVFTAPSVLTVTLEELEEFVEYSIRVRGITSVGAGPFSVAVVNTTFEDSPSNYPEDLVLADVTANEMLVTWNPVPLIHRNGIITHYEVEFNQSTFEEISMINSTIVDKSVLVLQLIDLEEVVEYSVRVRAFSRVGAGPYTPVKKATTLEAPPSTYPSNFRAFGIESTEVLVVWSRIPEIDQNGIITRYEVYLEPLNFTDVLVSNLSTTVNRFQFFNELQEFAVYSVMVRGFTAIGPGPFSPVLLVTTFEDRPSEPPQNVEANGISLKDIRVSWEEVPLIHQNGIIISYEVQFEALEFTEGLSVGSVETTELSLTVHDLEQDTPYNISVRALTERGPGPLSVEITVRTLNVPDQVRRPDPVPEEDISAMDATVQWDPPENPNGEIILYTVEFAAISTNFPAVPIRSKRQTDVLEECIIGGIGNLNRSVQVDGTQTSVTLTQLTPSSLYEFRVQAESTVGIGLFSPPQIFETAEHVPSPPLNLAVSYLNSSALEVTWDHPLCDYGNRTNYTIFHSPQPGDIEPPGEVGSPGSPYTLPPEETSFIITDLTPNTVYLIEVYASTNAGPGITTSEANNTDEDAPQMVTELTITSRENPSLLNAVFIEITWVAPTLRNGSFDYNLTYTAEQRAPYPELRRNVSQGSVIVDGDLVKFVIENGLPFAEYTITIYGFNLKLGVPGPSETITERSAPLRPTAVTDLRAVATSHQSIRVSWNFPEYPNGPIDHFDVYYKASDTVQQPPIENNNFRIRSVSGTDLATEITGLAAYTNYAVHVQAFGGPGSNIPGDIMEEILHRTNSTTPSCDGMISFEAATKNTISILLPLIDFSTGPLQFYGVIVIETRGRNFDANPPPRPSEFEEAAAYDPSLAQQYYITAAWNNATQLPLSYIVGNESFLTVNGITYSNTRLKSGEEYAMFYRVEIVSDNDTPLVCYSDYLIIATASESPSGVIIGGTLGGIALLILIILFCCIAAVLVQRRPRSSTHRPTRGLELSQVIPNPISPAQFSQKGELYDDILPDAAGYLPMNPQPAPTEPAYAEASLQFPQRPSRIVTDENEAALALDDSEERYTPTPATQRRVMGEIYDDIDAEQLPRSDSSQYLPMRRERLATPENVVVNPDHTYAMIPYDIQNSPSEQ